MKCEGCDSTTDPSIRRRSPDLNGAWLCDDCARAGEHKTDADCEGFLDEEGCCQECGVAAGPPCDVCAAVRFHVEQCPASSSRLTCDNPAGPCTPAQPCDWCRAWFQRTLDEIRAAEFEDECYEHGNWALLERVRSGS